MARSFYPEASVQASVAAGAGSRDGEEEAQFEAGRAEDHSTWQADDSYDWQWSGTWWQSPQDWHRGYGWWSGPHYASDDSTWRSNWGRSSRGDASSTRTDDGGEGQWFETPQGRVWGKTLNLAVEYGIQRRWFNVDAAFCSWWSSQQSENSVSKGATSFGLPADERPSSQASSAEMKEDGELGSRTSQNDDGDDTLKSKRKYSGKDHVPEHDGKISMREYERRVRIFQSTTTIDEEFQGGKLLERLQGDAWKAAETLQVSDIRCKEGAEILLRHLWEELEPLEYLRVFQTLSFFYDSFKRARHQEMTSYDTAFRTQCQRLSEAQAPLEGRAKAFWYLRKAGLSDELRRQVVSSAGGVYDYNRLRTALVAIVPQVASLDGAEERKHHHFESRRGRSSTPSHRVHAVLDDDEAQDRNSDDPSPPPSIAPDDLELEAEVLLTAAARKRSEFNKNRGFGRSESPGTREKRIADMKSRMPCAACKAAGKLVYGHWHSDPSCPEYGKKSASETKPKSVFVVSQPSADDSGDDSDDAYLVQVILMASAEKLRRVSSELALTDTCCARTVAGEVWVKQALEKLAAQGTAFYMCEDQQPFRFGDGPKVVARYAVVLPVQLPGTERPFLLRVSVVREDVPLLLSAKVLKGLGTVLNMADESYSFLSIGTSAAMISTVTGHIGFEIFTRVPKPDDLLEIDWEAFLESGKELLIMDRINQDTGGQTSLNPGSIKIKRGKSVTFCDKPLMIDPVEYQYHDPDSGSPHQAVCAQDVFLTESSGGSTSQLHLPHNHELSGRDEGAEEESRVHSGIAASDEPVSGSIGGDDCGEAAMDVPNYAANHHSEDSAEQLAQVHQACSSRTIRGEGDSMVGRRDGGAPISSLESGSSDCRVGELHPRCEGKRSSDEDGRGRRKGESHLSQLQAGDGAEKESPDRRMVLRLPSLSDLQRNFVTLTSRAAKDVEIPGQGQGKDDPEEGHSGGNRRDERSSTQSSSPDSSSGSSLLGSRLVRTLFGRRSEPRGVGDDPAASSQQGLGVSTTPWKPSPESPSEVRGKIRKGEAKRKLAKLGTCKRLWANAKTLAAFVCMLTVSGVALTASKSHSMFFGSTRPDILEVFGGAAEVSMQFSKYGWSAMQPCDVIYGDDLRCEDTRNQLIDRVRTEKPRLVVIEYPCRLWSKMADVNYISPQQKRRLAKLRKEEEPYLELCEQLFYEQIQRGDDALAENPLCSRSFKVPAMQRVINHPQVFLGVSHGCRFNLRSISTGLLLKKPTLWVSTSPEICDALSLRCPNSSGHVVHHHGECQGGQVSKAAGRYTPEIGEAIIDGYYNTLLRKDPSRLRRLYRVLELRMGQTGSSCKEVERTLGRLKGTFGEHRVYAVDDGKAPSVKMELDDDQGDEPGLVSPYESTGVDPAGISFLVPKGRKLDGTTKGLLRKLHCNLGHPSKIDLQRFMRAAGARQELIEAVGWMQCSTCARSQRPRLHRTVRVPPHELQFNDEIMVDCFYLKDVMGQGQWFMSMLDRSTMFHQVHPVHDHSPQTFVRVFMDGWIKWAGPPGEISIDMETGFGGKTFAQLMGEAGALVVPIAGQAHWQHGKIERHGAILKDMLIKVCNERDVTDKEAMAWACTEVTNAKNALIREHGFSPSQLVFGRDPRCFGELEENGEVCAFHPQIGDKNSVVARRMRFRHVARLAFIQSQASQMLNRTARNKTCKWEEPQIGDRCFFFRQVRKKGQPGVFSVWQGPGLVVGIQGQSNYWIVFGGRCFLVAQEHIREAIGEECLFGKPEVQQALALFKERRKKDQGVPYIDLTGQDTIADDDLDHPIEVDDEDMEMVEDPGLPVLGRGTKPPQYVIDVEGQPGWRTTPEGYPMLVAHRSYAFRTPIGEHGVGRFPYRSTWGKHGSDWFLLENEVKWIDLDDPCDVVPGGPVPIMVVVFHPKTRKQICIDSVPECIKKQRVHMVNGMDDDDDDGNHVMAVVSKRKAQKALDKEIPFSKIPKEHMNAFLKAEEKEWQSWVDYDAVEVLSLTESQAVRRDHPERIIRSRYVYRDKNAGLLDEHGNKMAVKAKARLCVQGQNCPDCASGNVKLDAPTVQHSSLLMFLHLTVSWGWLEYWRNGDISSAFLQGAESKGPPLYMHPPDRGLPGIGHDQILRLKRPVYGRPDAPKAWYDQLAGFIVHEMGFEKSLIDPALFIHRGLDRKPDALVVLHVDDLMISTNGGAEVESMVSKLCERFPFGEWGKVCDQPGGVVYCGKEILVENEGGKRVIKMRQKGFTDGRLELIPLTKEQKIDGERKASPEEVSDFRSVLGALQWLATQSRPDIAFMVNQLQKRVNVLQVKDLEVANQVVRNVKKYDTSLTFRDWETVLLLWFIMMPVYTTP